MSFDAQRQTMLERHLQARGIDDPRVLAAMARVPRERMVPAYLIDLAYDDTALPIAAGQTISQPYVVALTAQQLHIKPSDRILEVGTGSGYAAAIYAELGAHVYTIERHAELASSARARLTELGYRAIDVRHGDGSLGWPEHAPFDVISIAAASAEVPPPLLDQLAIDGRLILPLGGPELQELVRITRVSATELVHEELGAVQFVPLICDATRPV